MDRKQFLSTRGYNPRLRAYGGGEIYFDTKCWMLGIPVVAEPRCVSYHLSCGRGYSYHHDDYITNVFIASLSLGADMWAERAKLNWMRTGRKEVIDKLWNFAQEESREDKKWIEKRRKLSFTELLIERPWEKLNNAMGLKGGGNMLIYHNTWHELLEKAPHVKELYGKSELQKELDIFIRENLWPFVYKNDRYDQNKPCFP